MSAAFLGLHDQNGDSSLRVDTSDGGRNATEAELTMMRAAPLLADLLKRIHAAEFEFGCWPSEKEIREALAVAGVEL